MVFDPKPTSTISAKTHHMSTDYTKSSMLLDFSRGAQGVLPVCVGVLLGCAGQGGSKWTSVHTAETAIPPFFCAAKSNFKGPMVLFRVRGTRGLGKNTGRDCPGPICGSFGCFSPNPAELTTTDQREIDCRRQLRRSEQRESKSTEGE